MYAVGILGNYISLGVYSVAAPIHHFGGAVYIIVVRQENGTFKSSPWYVKFGKFQGVLKRREKIVNVSVNDVEVNFHMYLDRKGQAYFSKDVESQGEDTMLSPPSGPSSGDGFAAYDSKAASGDRTQHKPEIARVEDSIELPKVERRETGGNSDATDSLQSAVTIKLIGTPSRAWENGRSNELTPVPYSASGTTRNEAKDLRCDLINSKTTKKEPRKSAKSIFSLVFGSRSQPISESVSSPGRLQKRPAERRLQRLSSLERAELVADLLDRKWGTAGISTSVAEKDKIALSANHVGCDISEPSERECLSHAIINSLVFQIDTPTLPSKHESKLPKSSPEDFKNHKENEVLKKIVNIEKVEAGIMRLDPTSEQTEKAGWNVADEDWYFRTIVEEEEAMIFRFGEGLGKKLPEDRLVQIPVTDSVAVDPENGTLDSTCSEMFIMNVDDHIAKAPVKSDDDRLPLNKCSQVPCETTQRGVSSQNLNMREDCETSDFSHTLVDIGKGTSTLESVCNSKECKCIDPVKMEEVSLGSEGNKKGITFSDVVMIMDLEAKADFRGQKCDLSLVEPNSDTCLYESSKPIKLIELVVNLEGEKQNVSGTTLVRMTDWKAHTDLKLQGDGLSFIEPVSAGDAAVDSAREQHYFFNSNQLAIIESNELAIRTDQITVPVRGKDHVSESSPSARLVQAVCEPREKQNAFGMNSCSVSAISQDSETLKSIMHKEYITWHNNSSVISDGILGNVTVHNVPTFGESENAICTLEKRFNVPVTVVDESVQNRGGANGFLDCDNCGSVNGDIFYNEKWPLQTELQDSLPTSSTGQIGNRRAIEERVFICKSNPTAVPRIDCESGAESRTVRILSGIGLEALPAGVDRKIVPDAASESERDVMGSKDVNGTAKYSSTGIEISLCRHLIREGMGTEAASKAFASEKVSFDKFKCSGSAIVASDKLVAKIGERYFPWVTAAPVILGMMVFGMEVTQEVPGAIQVEATEIVEAAKLRSGALAPSNRWLWPFSFR